MNYLIFGGGGFIGMNLAKHIAGVYNCSNDIYCFDINGSGNNFSKYVNLDVRKPGFTNVPEISSSIIFNLAAIHTTPGHPDNEYFETNVLGAENICNFAREKDINTIVFTSSIAPYGPGEELKTENTLPMPNSPYGISKLTAEYIHKLWQAENPEKRKLIIVRPGIVFGPDERGNFTRLYNSLKNGFFFYPGRKDTIKAAAYVKDVIRILYEAAIYETPGTTTLNLTYFPPPTIEKICTTIASVTMVKMPKAVVPSVLLKAAAGFIYFFAKLLGKKINGIHPDRVKKLMYSTNVSGEKLNNSRYRLQYTLEEAIADWFNDCGKKELK